MGKNRVRLTIAGIDLAVASDDTESYIRSVGAEVEKAVREVTEKNPRASMTLAALAAALRFCDEGHRAAAAADNLRSQIKDYLEDASRARAEAETARREAERLRKEMKALREKAAAAAKEAEARAGEARAEEARLADLALQKAEEARLAAEEEASRKIEEAQRQLEEERRKADAACQKAEEEARKRAEEARRRAQDPPAPVKREGQGAYERPCQAPSQAGGLSEEDGFMSFFAKE